MKFLKRLFWVCVFFIILLISLIFVSIWYVKQPLQFKQTTPIEFEVTSGMTLKQALQTVKLQGVKFSPQVSYWVLRLQNKALPIIAGSYQLEPNTSVEQLTNMLVKGKVITVDVLIVEGWTFKQMRKAIESRSDLIQDTQALSDKALLDKIGVKAPYAEGLFFPSTYRVAKKSLASDIFRQAYRLMQNKLQYYWNNRPEDYLLSSAYQGLILASLVEKETGDDADRAKVASVFINRLKLGMKLQTDPTVIYGLGDVYQGRLRKKDLQTDHVYNTYLYNGLPPSPICLPGEQSLEVVFHPIKTNFLYFVSKGDKKSYFSKDLAEHNQAVKNYILRKKNGQK